MNNRKADASQFEQKHWSGSHGGGPDYAERVRINQKKLRSELKSQYDFIVCGSGSSGSVVARRLAENPATSVLLLEAGGEDDEPTVTEALQWIANLGTERDWNFQAQPDPQLNGRALAMSMGRVLGGGSSINAMMWSRGHKNDWDFFAAETGDSAWNYDSVLEIYKRIEDWQGIRDPDYRGTGGPMLVAPAPCTAFAPAFLEGAHLQGLPTFGNQNGRIMENGGGASIIDLCVRNGKRQSVFRSYAFPYMDRANLTVLPQALVTRLTFERKRTTGIELGFGGKTHRIRAALEVILSCGSIQTPKLLMQSGIGEQQHLQAFGISAVEHLPGVGRNLQNHMGLDCVWESPQSIPPNPLVQAVSFSQSEPSVSAPDLMVIAAEIVKATPENINRFGLPSSGWTLFGGLERPKRSGRVGLTGPHPEDPVQIQTNFLSEPEDRKAALACIELCRAIGNSEPMKTFVKREIMPGNLKGRELESYIRDAAVSYWHQSGTAKMGRDEMSVVDSHLKVYGIENLRIADASIMPRIPVGNTMAPCVVIGERAGEMLRAEHGL